ncbi:hypothetical protein PR048_031938, partial [Dryococelus australis]
MLERYLDMSKIPSQLLLDATDSPEMNYITLSKIIPMISCLTSQVKKFSSYVDCITELQTKLLAECNKRFGRIEYNTYAALGTILDPRFKNLHFQDPNACGRAIHKLKNIIKEDMVTSTSGSNEVAKDDYDFWLHHRELAIGQKRRRGSTKDDEVSLYLSTPVCLKLQVNSLEKWEDITTAVQTSMNVSTYSWHLRLRKRLFSKAGATITSRNCLIRKHLEKVLFLGNAMKADFY